jgi:hypothetical protein
MARPFRSLTTFLRAIDTSHAALCLGRFAFSRNVLMLFIASGGYFAPAALGQGRHRCHGFLNSLTQINIPRHSLF